MKKNIFSLQVFRGLAALAVVGHHAVTSTSAFIGDMPAWIYNTIGKGNFGVDFFFVLSGFIIMYIHQYDDKSLHSVTRYIKKRVVRVYPIYWCIAIPLALAYVFIPSLSEAGGRDVSVLSSIFLTPSSGVPVLSVAWTLIHEIMFYSLFLLFFYSNRVFLIFISIWVAGIITLNSLGEVPSGAGRYVFSLLNIEFVIGMIAASLLKKTSQNIAPALILGGITLGFIGIYFVEQFNYIRLIFALGMAMLIVGSATIEDYKKFTWPSILILLGNASFSIYLVHNPALSITQRILGEIGSGWEIGLLLGITVTTLLGVICHLTLEKKIINHIKSRGFY